MDKVISMLMHCVKVARAGGDSFSAMKSSVLSVRWAHLIASCAGTSNHAFLAVKQSGLLAGDACFCRPVISSYFEDSCSLSSPSSTRCT